MDRKKETFAMVLAGGGAKGIYQLGVFEALKEYPIEIVAISGSSIGGINAFAYTRLTTEELKRLWDSFDQAQLFDLSDDWSMGLFERTSLEKVFDDILVEGEYQSPVTVYNTICREGSNEAEYICLNGRSAKEVKDVLLATSAIPFVYSKVYLNGRYYEDGGVADNFPVKPLYLDGYRNFITVGLKADQRVDQNRYPVLKLIEIVPSEDLGDFFGGTLNFTAEYKARVRRLGYYDAKRALETYMGRENLLHTREYDARQISHEVKAEELQREIDEKLARLNKYLNT